MNWDWHPPPTQMGDVLLEGLGGGVYTWGETQPG